MKKKYLSWIYVVIWAAVIFIFSSQSGTESSSNNKFIVDIFKAIGINLDAWFGQITNFIIRKLAHFTEFFILYWLLYNVLRYSISKPKSLVIALGLVIFYAATDEFHQIFVQDRGPSIRDVLVDTGGGLLCMLIRSISWKKH